MATHFRLRVALDDKGVMSQGNHFIPEISIISPRRSLQTALLFAHCKALTPFETLPLTSPRYT